MQEWGQLTSAWLLWFLPTLKLQIEGWDRKTAFIVAAAPPQLTAQHIEVTPGGFVPMQHSAPLKQFVWVFPATWPLVLRKYKLQEQTLESSTCCLVFIPGGKGSYFRVSVLFVLCHPRKWGQVNLKQNLGQYLAEILKIPVACNVFV